MRNPRTLIRLAFVGIAPALIATAFMTGARAQMELSDANVTVDLSVLEDSGSATAPGDLPSITGFRRLLVPGSKFPVSTLHVPLAPGTVSPGAGKKAKKRRLTKMTAPPARAVKEPKPPAMPKSLSAPPPPPQQKIAKTELKIPKAPPPPAIPVEKVRTEPLKKAKPAVAKKIKEPKKLLPLPPPPPPQKIAKTEPKPLKTPPPPPPPVAQAVTPKAAKAPETQPDLQQQASLPTTASLLKLGKALHVEFKPTVSKLPTKAKEQLKALADGLKKNKNLRLQLRAYAGGKSVSSSRARRLSLSRALSVRTFLIENGIQSTRIDVRALGNKTAEKPVNRVDVNITER